MWIYKKIFAALRQYNMLDNTGKLAIAFSGGKDSMLLLNFFLDNAIIDDLLVIHIDPGFTNYQEEMKDYFKSNNIKYVIHNLDINREIEKSNEHPCFICSYRRREYIFRIARKNGFRKIAFGHNRDDTVVTFLLNILFHSEVATTVPVQEFFDGKIEIIRPLYFLWDDWIDYFIRTNQLPLFAPDCPYEGRSKRDEIKDFIDSYPHAKANIYKAIYNVNSEYLP